MVPEIPTVRDASRGDRWKNNTGAARLRSMTPVEYAVNVVTMATWLSVAAFSALAAIAPGRKLLAVIARPPQFEALDVTLDATSGGETSATVSRELETASPPPLRPLPSFRSHARPPAMPNLPVTAPLPEVPDFPATPRAIPLDQDAGQPALAADSGVARYNSGRNSTRARFAAGNTPAAPYPPYSRRNHQEGTVMVEFAVNSDGVVTAVFVKQPCPWPLLNQAAVRTVYSWHFPPGDFTTFECPVVFRIQ